MPTDDELGRLLRAAADPAPDHDEAIVDATLAAAKRRGRQRRQRNRLVAGGAALAVIAVIGIGITRPAAIDDGGTVRTADTTPSSTPEVAPEPDGGPIDDARPAAPDPTGWATIATSPLSPRVEAVAAWTGSEVLVIGGHENLCPPPFDCSMSQPFRLDGAAYSPAEDRWRRIADAPSYPGGEAVAVGGTVYIPSDRTLLAYDVGRDRWAVIPLDGFDGGLLAVVGAYRDGVLVSGLSAGEPRLSLLHPETGALDALEPPPFPILYGFEVAVVDDRIFAFGNAADGPDGSDTEGPPLALGAAFDADDGWRRIPDSEIIGNAPLIAAGGLLVDPSPGRSNPYPGGRTYGYGGVFDPAAERWRELPPDRPAAQWTADYPPIGAGTQVLTTDGILLDPQAGTWRPVPAPPGPALRMDAAVVWAGDRLFVWGGMSWRDGPATLLGAGFTFVPD